MRTSIIAAFIGGMVALLLIIVACGNGNSTEDNRDHSINIRNDTYNRATALYPIPQTQNFPLRAALSAMTVTEDLVNHPWYIYVLSLTGEPISYYVAQTVPINECDFLSSTEELAGNNNSTLLTAPSLDGIYYGGSKASGNCDAHIFFDYATGAMVWTEQKLQVSDVPFMIDVPKLTVQVNAPGLGNAAPIATPSVTWSTTP